MSRKPRAADAPVKTSWLAWVGRNPLVLLVGVLILLYLVTGVIQPGFLSFNSARNTLLQAAPLGILAAAQTDGADVDRRH